MASALPSTFRRAWSEFSLRFRVMTELSPSTLNFLTMFATVPMLIPCDLAQSACFKTGGWASSKSSNILHLLARVSFVDLLRSILLSNETSSSDRLTEYDFGLAIVASPLVVSDGRKYITGLYKCQCVESLGVMACGPRISPCRLLDGVSISPQNSSKSGASVSRRRMGTGTHSCGTLRRMTSFHTRMLFSKDDFKTSAPPSGQNAPPERSLSFA